MAIAVAIASFGVATAQAYAVATPTPTVGEVSDGQYIPGKVVHVGEVEVPVGDHIVSSSQLKTFFNSSTPKQVIVDTSTGKIVSAMKATNPAITPMIVNRSNCYAGDSCLLSGMIPYAHQGFAGTGTATGSWPYRSGFDTGSHTALSWINYYGNKLAMGVALGPNSHVTYSRLETGVQVTNYS